MTTINAISTLTMRRDSMLPWEFNLFPFFTVAETKKHMRIKFGWLWFYIAIVNDKE
jgi:hypothetical protein